MQMLHLMKDKSHKWPMHFLLAVFMVFSFSGIGYSQNSYPFPQNVDYSFGLKPDGVDDATVQAAYSNWKTNYVTSSGACGKRRVIFDYYPGTGRGKEDKSRTVSEGVAYGMLIAAYMGDQSLFDDLWAYYKLHRNGNGVMHWRIDNCSVSGQNGASDAELDVAMALIVASYQWQSDSYLNDAKMMIRIIREKEFEGDVLKPGDMFGGNSLVCPSYFSPAYYRVFATIDAGYSSFWTQAAAKGYDIIDLASGTTGLVPDWCNSSGGLGSGASTYEDQGKNFIFDAIRTPFRSGIDYLWHGHPDAKAYCEKISTWLTNNHGSANDIGQKYGTQLGGNEGQKLVSAKNNTFIGCFGVGLMGTDLSSKQSFLNSCYQVNVSLNPGYGEYFNASFKLLSLLVMTGNFYLPPPDQCEGPDLGADRSLCEGSPLTLNSNITNRNYVWKRNGTILVSQNSATLSVTTPGDYEVVATDPSGCVRRDKVNVGSATMTPDFIAKAGPGSIILENTSVGGISNYTWTLDGADPSTEYDHTYSNLASGTYEVTLTVDNSGFGCSGTAFKTKTVIVGEGEGLAVNDFAKANDQAIYAYNLGTTVSPVQKDYCSTQDMLDNAPKVCPVFPCGNLEIVANAGEPNEWDGYGIGWKDASFGALDLSDAPFLSIKMYATSDVEVGLKLQQDQFSCNALAVDVTTEPQIFTVDFSTQLTGWDNGLLETVTIDAWDAVDAIQILPFNGDVTWTGTVTVEWFIVGAKSIEPPSFSIKLDENGYTDYSNYLPDYYPNDPTYADCDITDETGLCYGSVPDWEREVSLCPGEASTLVANSCDAQTINWYRESTFLSSGQTIDVDASGTYYVELINEGGTYRDSVIVNVGATPEVDFAYTVEDFGFGYRFLPSYTNADDWLWDYGTTPVSPTAPTWEEGYQYYDAEGQYEVCLTVTNTTCDLTETICKTIDVTCVAPMTDIANFTVGGVAVANGATYDLCANDEATVMVDIVENAAVGGYGWYSIDGKLTSDTNFVDVVFTESTWIKVSAYNACGETVEDSIYINVNPSAVAGFTFEKISETELIYAFTADWVGDEEDGVIYSWDVDGSPIGEGIYIEHTIVGGGPVDVTLTVINDCGDDNITQAVGCSYPVVSGAAISGPVSLCGNDGCQDYAVTGITGADALEWVVPASGTICDEASNTASISFTATTTVGVVASNACGAAPAVELEVVVNDAPTTSEITGDATPACAESGISYSVTGGAGSTYEWTVPAGASIASGSGTASIMVDFGTSNGTISVVETSTNGCIGETKTLDVTLSGCALSAAIDASPSPACTGETVTVRSISTGTGPGTSFTWDFGTGATPATAIGIGPHDITYSTSGTKTISLNIAEGGIQDDAVFTVTVGAAPVSPSTLDGPSEVCSGETATYSIPLVANATTYKWTYPLGATVVSGNDVSKTIEFGAQSGIVSVTPENACGTGTKLSVDVSVGTIPSTSAITGPAGGFCEEELSYSVVNTVGSSYEWTVPSGTTILSGQGTNSITISLGSSPGTISVLETSSTNCVGTVVTKPVTVNGCGLAAFFTVSDNEICLGESITLTNESSAPETATYSWNFGAGATPASSFDKDPGIVTYSTVGTKIITLTLTSGTESETLSLPVDVLDVPSLSGVITGPESVCLGAVEEYTISPATGASVYLWSATGATVSGTSTKANVTFGSTDAIISVKARNSCGESVSLTKNVAVITDGTASVSIDVPSTTIKEGENLTFTAVPVNGGDGATFSWYVNTEFAGSGMTFSSNMLTNPSEVYVVMTSTVECVTDKVVESTPVTIIVEEIQPGEAFAGSDFSTCDLFAQLDGNAPHVDCGGSGTWTVVSGNGNFGDPNDPKTFVSGLLPGVNVFRWTLDGGTCPSDFDDVEVTFNNPSVTITSDVDRICEGSLVSFTADVSLSSAGDSYSWLVDNVEQGTSSSFSSSTLDDQAAVKLVYTSSICDADITSNSVKITVDPMPSVSVAGSTINTTNTSVTLNANAPAIGSGTWEVSSGTGSFVNISNPKTSVSGLSDGANEFLWTITSGDCPSSVSKVTVNKGSVPDVPVISGPTSVTAGEQVTYTVSGGSGSTFDWTLPSGATLVSNNGSSIVVVFGDNFYGPIGVVESNNFGDSDAASLFVEASSQGIVKPVIFGSGRVKAGDYKEYYIENPLTYSTIAWNVPAGLTVIDEDDITGTLWVFVENSFAEGTLTVTVTNESGDSESASKLVSASTSPVQETIVGPAQVEPNQVAEYEVPFYEGSTYSWTVPDGATIIGPATGNKITVQYGPTANGVVSVVETNDLGQSGPPSSLNISNVTSTYGARAFDYEVRPNPFTQTSSIRVNTPGRVPVDITVINENGTVVEVISGMYSNEKIEVGSDLVSGVYFVKVALDNKVEVIKLVKI